MRVLVCEDVLEATGLPVEDVRGEADLPVVLAGSPVRRRRGVAELVGVVHDDRHESLGGEAELLLDLGTRYLVGTTDTMVDAVRQKTGYGDPEILDLFYAISMRNVSERMNRLMAGPLPAA